MKYLLPILLITTLISCDKEEPAALTIRVTNETTKELFSLSNYMEENVFEDLAINASSSYNLPLETEFPHGIVYPQEIHATLVDGSHILIRSPLYCGTGLKMLTAEPKTYNFSIRYIPEGPFDPANGDFGIVEAHYAFVPKQ